MLSKCILSQFDQPLRDATANEVIASLRSVYALPWTERKDRHDPLYFRGAPPGCTLGVKVAGDKVALIVPECEDYFMWAVRENKQVTFTADMAFEQYCQEDDRSHDEWKKAPTRIIGYRILLIPSNYEDLCPEFKLARLYSEREIIDLIKPYEQRGFVWCIYPSLQH